MLTICKGIELAQGINLDTYGSLPHFADYDDLKSILEAFFEKYEEFKVAVVESGILK